MTNASCNVFKLLVHKRFSAAKAFLFVIGILSLLLSSCAIHQPPIQISYTPTGYIRSNIVDHNPIKLLVIDERPQKIFMRSSNGIFTHSWADNDSELQLASEPSKILTDAFKMALISKGYQLFENASITYEVKIKQFIHDYAPGLLFGMSSTTTIAIDVSIRESSNILVLKSVSEKSSHKDATFFNDYISRELEYNLNRVVDKTVEDSEIGNAISKAQQLEKNNIIESTKKISDNLDKRVDHPQVWQPINRQQVWILAIGIENYKNISIPKLTFAKSDAECFQNWLMNFQGRNLSRDNVHVLFNEQATRSNLLDQIDWLRKKALPEDLVIVYFSGHGAPELATDGKSVDAKYLILYDTDPTKLYATGFSLDDLTKKLDDIKVKTQVVILEACYAGPVGEEILKKTPTADLEIRPRLMQEMGEKGGRVILSASSGRQIAIGSDTIKGGLFTHYLLEAWGDGSRRLLSDCFEDAKEKVRRAANELGSTQEPCIFGDRNIDIILKPQ